MRDQRKTKSQLIDELEGLRAELDGRRTRRLRRIGEHIQRHQQLFGNSRCAIRWDTLDGHILDCNQRHIDLFGYSRRETRGMKLFDYYPLELRARLDTVFSDVFKEGIVDFETRMLKKNGEIFPVEVTAVLNETTDGPIIQSLIRDVSEREETLQKLKNSEQKYRHLFEQSFDAIIVHQSAHVMDANQRACDMLGYTKAQLRTMTLFDFHDPSEYDDIRGHIKNSDGSIHFESRYRKSDGDFLDVEIYSSISDGQNQTKMAVIRDITTRKQHEREIRDSEQRFRAIFDVSLDGMVLTDTDGRVLMANPAACRMHGYSREEMRRLSRNDLTDTQDPRFQRIDQERRRHGKVMGDLTSIRKDGSTFPSEVSSVTFRDSTDLERTITIIRDITHRKRFEKELRAARSAAEQANRAKGEFLANMSHEIRTPLNGVLGVLNLLTSTELDSDQMDLIQTGRRSAGSLLTLINDILDFSKIEANQLDLDVIDFNLGNTLAEILELPMLQAHDKGLAFIYEPHPDLPSRLRGDPGRLRQIILNLTSNAIKFTSQGRVILCVYLENETPRDVTLRFEVSDTGIGIPDEKLETVFDAFKQSDTSTTRRYGGTGLGLSISKRLATLMGGDIGVESTVNQGSRFWFTVVLSKQTESREKEPVSQEDIRGRRILLVDDNRADIEILKKYLEAWDCQCDVAASGKAALNLMRAVAKVDAPYDAAIIDMRMPGMDGAELGRRIKADPLIKETSMVMLTCLGLRGDASRMEKIGYAAYMTKPILRSQLLDCLLTVLRQAPKTAAESPPALVTQYSLSEDKRNAAHLLIVEDNDINQKLALKMVEHFGFTAQCRHNGAEAVRALEIYDFHLVLMDVQMPEMDGIEATRIIRDPASGVRNHDIGIIAMTAHAMKGDRERCLAAGMDDYISKPIQPQELLHAIEKQLSRRENN